MFQWRMTACKWVIPAKDERTDGGMGLWGDGPFSFPSPCVFPMNVPCFFRGVAVSCPVVSESSGLGLSSDQRDHALATLPRHLVVFGQYSKVQLTSCSCSASPRPLASCGAFHAVLNVEVQPGEGGSPRKVGVALLVWDLGSLVGDRQLFLKLRRVPGAQSPPFGPLSLAPAVCFHQICQDHSQCLASIRTSRVSKLTEFS